MYVNLISKMFTVAPPVCVAKYSTKNLSDDEGGEEGEILEVMVTSVFKNGCDKKWQLLVLLTK